MNVTDGKIELNTEAAQQTTQQTTQPATAPLRIGFWGTRAAFSNTVLMALLNQYPITAVVLPRPMPPGVTVAAGSAVEQWLPPTSPPASQPSSHPSVPSLSDELMLTSSTVTPDTLQTAWHQHIPVYGIRHVRLPAVVEWVASLALDVICVACFPWRIPAALLALPTHGFLNVHPSLLPAYRGPAPLFWQLRAGVREVGVTVHWMDATLDTGAIAAQQALSLPDGITGAAADHLCAQMGARLLDEVLQQLTRGLSPRQAQPRAGRYASWPTAADFRLCAQWSAQHAYNFMRGTAEWQQPYPLRLGDEEILLQHALAYTADQTLPGSVVRDGSALLIQFQPGVLRAVP